jgi:hypothetical protein
MVLLQEGPQRDFGNRNVSTVRPLDFEKLGDRSAERFLCREIWCQRFS